MSEKWICPACKGENAGTAKFCLTCGAPRFENTMELSAKEEPEEPLSFSELKERREPHGALRSVSYSFYANGMMINSHEESEVTLKRLDNKEAELFLRKESGITGGSRDRYRVPLQVLSEIEAIAAQENLPAWSKLRYKPDPRFMPTDYSSSSHLSLTYDNIDPKNPREEYFSIDLQAVPQEGSRVISDMLDRMRTAAEGLEPEMHEDVQPMKIGGIGGFMGMKEALEYQQKKSSGAEPGSEKKLVLDDKGLWVCPECGEHNAGKFCAGCGSRRPEL